MSVEHQVTLRTRLAGLVQQPDGMQSVTAEEVPALVALTAAVQAELAARMAPTPRAERPAVARLLTIAEVADRARKSPRWVRDHWRTEMPFAVRKGRTVLFPEVEFERWLKRS